MGKTFKLFNGELKKIFLGPAIFIMTALLILLLTLSPKFFSPSQKEDLSTQISLSTTNVLSCYSSFLEYKNEYNLNLISTKNNIDKLISDNEDFKTNLVNSVEEIQIKRMELSSLIINGSEEDCLGCFNELISKVNSFQSLYKSYTEDYVVSLILVNADLDYDIRFTTTQFIKILSQAGDINSRSFYINIDNSLDNYKCASTLKSLIYQTNNLNYSSDNLTALLNNYFTKKDNYKSELLIEINNIANEATVNGEYNISNSNINKIKQLSFNYLSCNNCLNNILRNQLMLEISDTYSDKEMSAYIGFENFNTYKYQESLSKNIYLYDNDLVDKDYATMFSFNANSSNETNAFDYMYFTIEIASFLIIAFTVILGAGMVSKEFTDGTIKLLAIRPFKRKKIILSKIYATMFFAFIFVLVSTIVACITGIIIYGISFPSMLVVFNATTVFTLPIWVVFLIYLLCLFIKVWVYSLLAIMISVLFKSYVAAVCISSGIYILNIIVTFVSNGANWLKYNIFANLDLFKFFGGSFNIHISANQNLTNLFSAPVFADTNILLSIIIICSLIFLLNIITFSVFNKRDIV